MSIGIITMHMHVLISSSSRSLVQNHKKRESPKHEDSQLFPAIEHMGLEQITDFIPVKQSFQPKQISVPI